MTNDRIKPKDERLLVCLGPDPSSAGLINSAQQLAHDLKAKWFVVFVQTPRKLLLPEEAHNRIIDQLSRAEQLGAETFTLTGRNVAEEIINFASQRKVTKIMVGRPRTPRWKKFFLGSPVDKLTHGDGGFDVYVISPDLEERQKTGYTVRPQKIRLSDYGAGLLIFLLADLLCFLMYPYFHLSNLIMIYLLGVMITAASCGRGPAIFNSFLSVLAFDFFFVSPRFSFTVDEAQYIVTFIVMFLVALVISHLADRLRQQAAVARDQERQANAMHGLSRLLAGTRGRQEIFNVALQYISEIFDCQVMVLQTGEQGKFEAVAGDLSSVLHQDIMKEIKLAHRAYETGRVTGLGTPASPASENLYVPIREGDLTFGLLVLRPEDPERLRHPERLNLLESLCKQVALSLEVEHLMEARKS
jgi:two-component system sensor histidine kinase KdpD